MTHSFGRMKEDDEDTAQDSMDGGMVAPPFAWHIQELPEFHDDGQGHGWLCDVGARGRE